MQIWSALVEFMKPEIEAFKTELKALWSELGLTKEQTDMLRTILINTGTVILGIVLLGLKLFAWALLAVVEVVRLLILLFKSFLDQIKKGRESIDQAVKSYLDSGVALQKIYDTVRNLIGLNISKLIDNLSKLWSSSSGSSKKSGGKEATGGLVTPSRTYTVGERGQELFQPITTGRIIPNDQIKSGGGNTLSLNVNVGVYAGTETEKRNIAESLYKGLVQLAGMQNKSVAELLGA